MFSIPFVFMVNNRIKIVFYLSLFLLFISSSFSWNESQPVFNYLCYHDSTHNYNGYIYSSDGYTPQCHPYVIFFNGNNNTISTNINTEVSFTIDPIKYWGYSQDMTTAITNLGSCRVNIDSNNILTANFNKNSEYYNYIREISNIKEYYYYPSSHRIPFSTILDEHYYMNTSVVFTLKNESGNVINRTTQYFLIKPKGINLTNSINRLKLNFDIMCGRGYSKYCGDNFTLSIKATPVDLKCDYNESGIVDETEGVSYSTTTSKFHLFNDSDGDGWDNNGNYGKGRDLCPNHPGLDKYRGCPYEYTVILGGNSYVYYNGRNLICYYNDNILNSIFEYSKNYISFNGKRVSHKGIFISYHPNRGNGTYSCYNKKFGNLKDIGDITLRFNGLSYCSFGNGDNKYFVSNGNSITMYKYDVILPNDSPNSKKVFNCNLATLSPTYDSTYNYSSPIILGHNFNEYRRNSTTGMIYNPNKRNSVSCDFRSGTCEFKSEKLNFTKTESKKKMIIVLKNGKLIKQNVVNPMKVALKVQDIHLFNNAESVSKYINKTVNLMSKFNIIENLTYNETLGKTNINISLKNYTGSSIQNLTIYQIIPKSIAESTDDINFISNGGGKLIVLDKEPIIGWYFNESNGDNSVDFQVKGNVNDSTIIVTQEPILFNEGNLIINYREGAHGCAAGEVHLFDLSDLVDSKILDKNTGNYQVCVAYLNSSVNLFGDNAHVKYINISSYIENSSISSNFSQLPKKITMSTNDSNIYWGMIIQKNNPNGNFSCLGSYKELNKATLFGDCGYNPNNRIWLHLGSDYIPPTTKLTVPYLAHSAKVILDSKDNIGGSGFANLTYRVKGGETAWKTVTSPHVSFELRCPTDSGCTKIVEAYAYDKAGNRETTKNFSVKILDKGTACESSCLAIPSPNRYLAQCNNINGCHFYKINSSGENDNGKYVAKQCNFLTVGSYASYNSTYDIKCPNGPFRKKVNTNDPLYIFNSRCENIIKIPYPVLINGEHIIMDVVFCHNPYYP